MEKNKESAIVLLSGGQDSVVSMFWAKKKFKKVLALSFIYGQKNVKEIECAQRICKEYDIEHVILDVSSLQQFKINFNKSDGSVNNNLIYGRNMFFLSFAAAYARNRNILNIVIGISENDIQNFPDCRKEFIFSINTTLNLAMDYNFKIYAPLIDKSKKEIWKFADDFNILKLVMNKTLTCYNGVVGNGCGACVACLQRNAALKDFFKDKENKYE